MRNDNEPKIKKIIALAEKLPYFSLDDLAGIETNRAYLKVLFSRYKKKGKLIRLKKGIYVTKEYIDNTEKSGEFSAYPEFIAGILYEPSYLSMDYVLYEHNLLTEIPGNFISVAKNKTACFFNRFGNFFYHKIKDDLFTGFEIIKKGDFIVYKATKAKALFDFLYLRKNHIVGKKSFEELRLNLDALRKKDKEEIKKYVKIEKSRKMAEILSYI